MRLLTFSAITFLLTSCATTAPPAPAPAAVAATPCRPGDALLNAVLWMQESAEYKANAMQAYTTARQQLDAGLADPMWSAIAGMASAGLPPAIILDSDETLFDNTGFEGRMLRQGLKYDAKAWSQWVAESTAGAIPGSIEFLRYAQSRGVAVFFVTNRKEEEEAATRRNIENLGLTLSKAEDTVLVRGEHPEWSSGDKTPRREFVASKHRVLLLLGDDLNDFVPARSLTSDLRDTLVRDNAANWGTKWIILPNAMYGSWEDAIADGRDCAQLQKKRDALSR